MKTAGLTLFIVAAFALPFIFALILSRHRAWGSLRDTALNPMLLVAFFTALGAADFASVAASGYGKLGGHTIHAAGALPILVAKYVLMLLAFTGGIGAALYSLPRRYKVLPVRPLDMRGLLLAAYVALLAAWFLSLSAYASTFFSFTGSVITRRDAGDDPVVYVTSILLLPGLCYALPKQSYKVAIPLVAVTLALVFFSGARARLLYALVPLFFYLVMVRDWRLPKHWFLSGALALGLLSIVALNARLAIKSGRDITTEQLFKVTDALNSNDLPFAEANIILSRTDRSRVNEYFGEDLVSFVAAPLPRAVFPPKPFSGSVQFTMAFDPVRWRSYESGLVIGAINEIENDYPYPVALVVVALFGGGWAWVMVTALRSRSIHGFAWRVALYIFLFNFFRNDLFIAGGALWVFAIYWVPVEAYRRFKLGAGTPRRRARLTTAA